MTRTLVVIACLSGLLASSGFAASLDFAGSGVVTSPGNSARGLSVSADGKSLYVAGIQDRLLAKYDVESQKVVARASLTDVDPGAYGKAVWVDSAGDIWAPLTVPMLAVYSADLKLKAYYDLSVHGVVAPEGAVVSPARDVYVTDRNGRGGIFKFRLQNGALLPAKEWGTNGHVSIGKDLRQPCLTPAGDLVVGSFGGSELYLVGAVDGQVSVVVDDTKAAYHVAIDDAGRIYVAHYDRHDVAVSVFEPDGSLTQTWSAAELGIQTETSGVAVSQDGTCLFVLDQRTGQGGIVRAYRVR